MKMKFLLLSMLTAELLTGCGYDAADSKDLEAKQGQIVGVLVDSNGKAHPDAVVQLIASDGTSVLSSNNMDSDGSFSLWPSEAGTFNIVGVFGETEKAIKQSVTFNPSADALNVGTLEGQTVSALSVHVTVPDGFSSDGVKVEVLGSENQGTTVTEGLGAIAGIPAGTYTVRFSKEGLTTKTVANVILSSGDNTTLDPVDMSAP